MQALTASHSSLSVKTDLGAELHNGALRGLGRIWHHPVKGGGAYLLSAGHKVLLATLQPATPVLLRLAIDALRLNNLPP